MTDQPDVEVPEDDSEEWELEDQDDPDEEEGA